ncbi:MAG: hypothetical protein AB1486_26210 [Planctomycetota bacterium]
MSHDENVSVSQNSETVVVRVALQRAIKVHGTVKVPPGFRLQGVFFSRERGHSALIASVQPGGQYVADGFAPGEPYHPEVTCADESGRADWWVAPSREPLYVGGNAADAVFDFEPVPAALLFVDVLCDRLPLLFQSAVHSPLHQLTGEGATISVLDSAGREIQTKRFLGQEQNYFILVPGEYTVRVLVPGSEPQSRPVSLRPGLGSATRIALHVE